MNATGTSATAGGLTNGRPYYFVVTARNAGGESAPSAEVSVTPQAAARAPSAPSIQNVSAGNAQATVRWATVSDAFAYNLYYSESSFAGVTDLAGAGITSAFRLPRLELAVVSPQR